jgi:hypothetical protein
MGAREQAEEAAIAVQVRASRGEKLDIPVECAKVASDKWERYVHAIGMAAATSLDDVDGLRTAIITIQAVCENALDDD